MTGSIDHLKESVLVLLRRAQADYGYADAIVEREVAKALDPSWQTNLLPLIAANIGQPEYWNQPRSILEAGCGSGSFVTATLGLGHDAWGIDNDADRISIGHARIDAFGLDQRWKDRVKLGDATATGFDAGTFDVVLGHQFIEHVPDPAGTINELLRVTKRGGFLALYAPDYRAPFEAHYEIPWPPFLSRDRAKAWLDGFGRPHGGLDYFFYTTASQIVGILQPLDCTIVTAYNDRQIEAQVMKRFDLSSVRATYETATRFRDAFAARQLPEHFMIATSFGIVAQKI